MDPFLDLIRLLRPQAMLWAGVEARGRWGLAFRKRNDLLFCRVDRGACKLLRPGFSPILLQTDDFVLVRTSTPFCLASDTTVTATDSEELVAATGSTALRLGSGTGERTTLRGGRFVFDSTNERLLTGMLPQVVHVSATETASVQVRAYLAMSDAECRAPGPGSGFVVARLMELLLVEILRSRTVGAEVKQSGLLAGLADPVARQALVAMHRDVARPWTTAQLAKLCGTSRSAFGARFSRMVGIGPIAYLQQWRMALAKDEIRRGSASIAEIAHAIGFQSGSAFSTAFTRAIGYSPRRFAAKAGMPAHD